MSCLTYTGFHAKMVVDVQYTHDTTTLLSHTIILQYPIHIANESSCLEKGQYVIFILGSPFYLKMSLMLITG